jgi:hypothetical protein
MLQLSGPKKKGRGGGEMTKGKIATNEDVDRYGVTIISRACRRMFFFWIDDSDRDGRVRLCTALDEQSWFERCSRATLIRCFPTLRNRLPGVYGNTGTI